jgi:hypothetical protein
MQPGFSSLECRECARLLEAYTRKTREYLDLMRRRRAAILEHQEGAIEEIHSQLQVEREQRASAKRDLLDHRNAHRTGGLLPSGE